jgi:hypothetical protein
MSNPSNLYAEKIFAEHPATLWALDDQVDYLSLVSEEERTVSSWKDISGNSLGLSAVTVTDILDQPFPQSNVTKITGDVPSGESGQITCISIPIKKFTQFDYELGTFAIGGYFYAKSPFITGIHIGYEYRDDISGEKITQLKYFETLVSNEWIFLSETFQVPLEDSEMSIVIKINYRAGSEVEEDYVFFTNGITLGQWSEEFCATSLGSTKTLLPSSIAIESPTTFSIEAKAYGLQENPGYYIINNNSLLAKNSGIPMVYGASNVTVLSPNPDPFYPSLIIPGLGFLNKEGQYNSYTLEFWIRINSDATLVPLRIVGPIGSSDGIYVDGPFLKLKIGNTSGSYFIGEWTRPMLVDLVIKNDSANLLINGESVISLSYTTSDLDLPYKLNNGKNQDWVGFYAWENVAPIEIDCVAIYTYEVPSIVAKRRFVYGQGVEFPEGINQAYSGSSIYIDYPFADYTNNYSYPNIGKWQQGKLNNLSVANNVLSTPDYELPEIYLSNSDTVSIYADNDLVQQENDLFFSFRPSATWAQQHGYLLFSNLNMLREKVRSFYGTFKVKSLSANDEVLFLIESGITKNTLSIVLNNTTINYVLKYNGQESVVYSSYNIYPGEPFSVALDLDLFSDHFGGDVAAFLGNFNSLELYVGGKNNFSNTFSGNIYNVGFCNESNHSKIEDLFNEIGTSKDYENLFNTYTNSVNHDGGNSYFGTEGWYYNSENELQRVGSSQFWDYYLDGGNPGSYSTFKFKDHTASYTLKPKVYFDEYSLDIDVSCSWEDYVPLTYFSQYIKDARGDDYYDLDFIQFNLNYPSPSKFLEEEQTGSWTYGELQNEYSNPIQRTYDSLDNQLFTGYMDYSDLKNKSTKNYKYDTSSSLVRSYVTFQYIESGANAVDGYFINKELPPKEGVVNPGNNWMNTKYEVINNMIIYPPSTADTKDLAIVTHLEFLVSGILRNKISIKSLEYASQSFNESSPNPIGTRFGNSLYPYTMAGDYFDYKSKNPFTIYKGSSPYLYLTRTSGIELKGTYDPLISRGLSIPINENVSSDYKIMAMQSAIRFDQDFFPYAPTEIFEIESESAHIKFFIVANGPDGKRAKIYAINARSGQLEDGIAFYWNGKLVKEPTLTVKEWGFLGVYFPVLLDFKNMVGSLRINGPITFNTISYYKSTNLIENQRIITRPWFNVKTGPNSPIEWAFWAPEGILWRGVLIRSSTSPGGVNPSTIYKSYTGTNKIIVDSEKILRLKDYKYSLYSQVTWTQSTNTAV